MKTAERLFVLSAIVLAAGAGCVRTQVTNEVISSAPGSPYRRIVVCSFSGSQNDAVRLENSLAARLRKHKVDAESCDAVLASTASVQDTAGLIRDRFDAVLITRREPKPQPEPHENSGLQSILLGPRAPQPPTPAQAREDSPRPSTVEQFATLFRSTRGEGAPAFGEPKTASEETVVEPYGPQRFIYGAADLIATMSDQLVWSLGGYVAGGKYHSISRFIKVLVRRIEGELKDNGLIP